MKNLQTPPQRNAPRWREFHESLQTVFYIVCPIFYLIVFIISLALLGFVFTFAKFSINCVVTKYQVLSCMVQAFMEDCAKDPGYRGSFPILKTGAVKGHQYTIEAPREYGRRLSNLGSALDKMFYTEPCDMDSLKPPSNVRRLHFSLERE